MQFIPAKESTIFIKLFRIFVKFLFKLRFKNIWLRQDYVPSGDDKTVYYLNHNSWWDGLIPLLLNEYLFHQNARALMEDRQLERYRFFRKIGAFSINRDDPRSAITSLRYAVRSMNRPRASLFIYPEGSLTPPGSDPIFEGGLAWLSTKLENIDYVPIGIHMHTLRSGKPELHIYIGESLSVEEDWNQEQRNKTFENKLVDVLAQLRESAGFDNSPYRKFL